MSKLLNNMVGDYIFISKNIYPTTAIYYRNKKVLKSEQVDDFNLYIANILSKINRDDYMFNDLINKFDIYEVIITEKGVIKLSMEVQNGISK